ncbi:expressed unknown protein [Seminavis robusta]|uniref:Stc1 domain-containing protein n=1 Tax=Seminavis robusta TaxID=568900 RepID=A0A9N8EMZ3_9STRA|nr:expressed unknown protein [Seminavis robusta]|eukprot:Sro1441_g272980.1 n/a (200) ;mRNA; r:24745-25444
MSTPVVTDKWAGNFDCDFCRRKRLVGEEFSKKARMLHALEKYRKNGGKLKCKQCVQEQEEKERQAAAAKRSTNANATSEGETLACKSCTKELDASQFNKNQWNKGAGKARCRSCVEKALEEEKQQQASSQATKLQAAKDKVAQAEASGNAQAILKAESELAALEAEKVTGLKPVKMSSRAGGGRGRGRGGRGRGRGGRR